MANPESKQKRYSIPDSFNYVGVFLTFRCNNNCSFCINRNPGSRISEYAELPGSEWVDFFHNLDTHDVPVTLQGGEPGLHEDFLEIVRDVSADHKVDILTTLDFDLKTFVSEIPPERINRPAPYAPIRVSYHPMQMDLAGITKRVKFLMDAGFRVGLYGVLHPEQLAEIEEAERVCSGEGIDFRTKPFLGVYRGEVHGAYAYPEACYSKVVRKCECAGSELLVAPDGSIHRCHHHLYNRFPPISSITGEDIRMPEDYLPCDHFGECNPCDVKVKNNRFQQFGHVSTRIRAIDPPIE